MMISLVGVDEICLSDLSLSSGLCVKSHQTELGSGAAN
jgi:hypothetical protein